MVIEPRRILEQLADGRFHSGEALARSLGVSRTAVWKHLQSVGEQFELEIHAVRGRGYRLVRPLEMLSVSAIESELGATQRAALSAIELFDSLPSTNRYLAAGIDDWGAAGRACFAEYQTAGRGRRGRAWISPFGANLYCSLYWCFDRAMADLSGLSLAAGVAGARALERLGLEGVSLKWPNDIHVDERKLGGILVEVFGPTSGPVAAIIGFGLNVDMPDHAAREIDQPWTDLRKSMPRQTGLRNRAAGLLLDELVKTAGLFDSEGWRAFHSDWVQFDRYVGRDVEVQSSEGTKQGRYRGVDQDGGLLLEQGGRTSVIHAGDVTLRAAMKPL